MLRSSLYSAVIKDAAAVRKGPSSSGAAQKANRSSFFLDLFSYSPAYEYTSSSSHFGAICSVISVSTLILFIVVTGKDFFQQPPELVKQGSMALPVQQNQTFFEPPPVALSISYRLKDKTSGNWSKAKVDFTNSDPYFRYKFTAKAIRHQDSVPRVFNDIPGVQCSWNDAARNVICPDENLRKQQRIQGAYNLPLYQYFEVEVLKCTGLPAATGCAPKEEIDALIKTGSVVAILHLKEENFDPITYHRNNSPKENDKDTHFNTKRGIYENVQTWRFYAVPGREQLTEVYMEGRYIKIEERLLGSPPLQETTLEMISFKDMATTYKHVTDDENEVMTFYFRLHPQTSSEEVQYWVRSLLDLFSYWGAMTSFLTTCSFGVLAKWYNRWKFQSNFKKETVAAMTNTSKLASNNRAVSDSIFEDIRLFNQSDFDKKGQLNMSREEFYFPSSPYGEIRKIALIEHLQKRKAANKIGSWYKQHLLQRRTKVVKFNEINQNRLIFPIPNASSSSLFSEFVSCASSNGGSRRNVYIEQETNTTSFSGKQKFDDEQSITSATEEIFSPTMINNRAAARKKAFFSRLNNTPPVLKRADLESKFDHYPMISDSRYNECGDVLV